MGPVVENKIAEMIGTPYGREFNFEIGDLHQRAIETVAAHAIPVSDLSPWRALTFEINAKFLAGTDKSAASPDAQGRWRMLWPLHVDRVDFLGADVAGQ